MELPVINNCDGCAACCMDISLPPFEADELDKLPNEVQVELALYRSAGRERNMICVWLDSGKKCSRYDIRPKTCRDFERGSSSCRVVRAQYGVDQGK